MRKGAQKAPLLLKAPDHPEQLVKSLRATGVHTYPPVSVGVGYDVGIIPAVVDGAIAKTSHRGPIRGSGSDVAKANDGVNRFGMLVAVEIWALLAGENKTVTWHHFGILGKV